MVAPRGSENLLAPPSLRPLGLVHGSARWGRALVDVFFFRPWEFVHGRFCVSAAVGWQTRNAIRNLTWGLNEITTRCASIH